jgi:predicted transcriptional regulator
MEKLTQQEADIMLVIWQLGPCYIKDIRAGYPGAKPPYTTVASVVKNLQNKKYLASTQHGNTYLYAPLISENDYKRTFVSGIVQHYFENSYKEMVSFFAKEQKISASDLEDILRMIKEGKE